MQDITTTTQSRCEQAWQVLRGVLDPEVPALSICDLGIVRDVVEHDDHLEVVLTPTYSGCPATEVISDDVRAAIAGAGLGPARVSLRRAPAWTTDWISDEGRGKLSDYGIAPPGLVLPQGTSPIRIVGRKVDAALACPRCGSRHTERLSMFGSTACKSMYRCLSCREPFEHFKAI
jgi:ring-1,2-phenylacetyl-CoA epoxidase subunit PaaD